jgi:hypothetical protein
VAHETTVPLPHDDYLLLVGQVAYSGRLKYAPMDDGQRKLALGERLTSRNCDDDDDWDAV